MRNERDGKFIKLQYPDWRQYEALIEALQYNGWEEDEDCHDTSGLHLDYEMQGFVKAGKNASILVSRDNRNDKYKIEIQIGDYFCVAYEMKDSILTIEETDRYIQFYKESLDHEFCSFDMQTCDLYFNHHEEEKE